MIRWRQVAAAFALGAASISAFALWWRRRQEQQDDAAAAPVESPRVTEIPPLPLPWDPRWEQAACPDGDLNCPMVWLRLGLAMAGLATDSIGLRSGDHDMGNLPGAGRYVEAVHGHWRARRASAN